MTLLLLAAKGIRHHELNALVKATRFLWDGYDPRFFWWEVVEISRKTFLIAFVLRIEETYILLRPLLAMLVSLVFLSVQWALKPFKRAADDWLSAFLQLALTLIFACVLLLSVCESDSETCKSDESDSTTCTCKQFGLGDDGDGLFLFFLLFSFVILLGTLFIGIYQLALAHKSAIGTIYLRTTGDVPELALAAGITYHLFLSHVWSSAQDQVAVIKRCAALYPALSYSSGVTTCACCLAIPKLLPM